MSQLNAQDKKKLVTLKSSDNEEFVVEESVAIKSETIKNIIEDCGLELISLHNIDGKTLAKVIQYCERHANDENGDLNKFDDEFLDVEQSVLFDLIQAANYLSIKDLLDKVRTKITNNMKYKSVDQVRKIFRIENNFSPKEEKEIRA
ncbi:hypothetical protein LguiA_030468 [Lonicera macranthoides]